MKPSFIYFKLEFKRILRSLPGILLGSLLIITLIAGALWLCSETSRTPARKKTVSVGIVAKEGEAFIDWMIDTVSQMENTKYDCRFLRLTEKKAQEEMRAGNINVIFLIPENYVVSIIRGENKHIIIRFPQEQTSIVSFLLKELGSAASSFILDSEAGIYTMQDYYREHNLPHATEDELNLNLSYIREIAGLSDGVQLEEVEIPGAYPATAVFFLSGIVLFYFLWGTVCGNVLTSRNHAFLQNLRLLPVNYPTQIIVENLAFFLCNLLGFFLLTFFACIVCSLTGKSAPSTLLATPGGIWLFALSLLPVLWLACSFIQWIYEMAEDGFGGAVCLFFSVLLLALLSGCFYPLEYLPLSIQKLAGFLPISHCVQYGLSCLYCRFSPAHFIWVAGFGGVFLCITILWRSRKMQK